MRILAIGVCFILAGCAAPVSKPTATKKQQLITIKGDGVNLGNKPQVTEMHYIQGHLYIY